MKEIAKAHWVANGDSMRLSMPIAKIDEQKRLVSGFASLDNEDSQADVVTAESSHKAFSRFRGNIREMHQPIAVGKMVEFREDEFYDVPTAKFYKGVYVTVYVSKGAQDTWEKVLDGTLSGFSIGGNVLDADTEFDKAAGKSVRFIKDYELVELSLVDNPANHLANVFSIEKMADGTKVVKGMITETKTENAFYCATDEIAKTSTESELACPECGDNMVNAGWFEYTTAEDKTEKLAGSVQKYLSSINDQKQGEPAINEGGVDVAEDTVNKAKPGDVDIDAAEQGKAETEVASSVESEETDVAEGGNAEAETEATDVSEVESADDDLAKMFDDLTGKIDESLSKNRDAIDAALTEVNERVEKAVTDLDSKVKELVQKNEELTNKFDSIKDELGKMEKSIKSLEEDGAVKKSGDLGGDSETVVEKSAASTWGGHFLGVNSLRD